MGRLNAKKYLECQKYLKKLAHNVKVKQVNY